MLAGMAILTGFLVALGLGTDALSYFTGKELPPGPHTLASGAFAVEPDPAQITSSAWSAGSCGRPTSRPDWQRVRAHRWSAFARTFSEIPSAFP